MFEKIFRKFIVENDCEYKVMRKRMGKAKVMGFDSYFNNLKWDNNPKNSILAIGFMPSGQIDTLLFWIRYGLN